MNPTDALQDPPLAGDAPAPPRRNRAELEQLAAEFVNSRIHIRAPAPRPLPKRPLAAAAAVLLLALGAWRVWPDDDVTPVREAVAVADNGDYARRLEAERERQRLQLQRSREYLARMAAADRALLGEMTARARSLPEAPSALAQVAAATCGIHVSELSKSGKLTYADVTRMKGAKLDPDTGNVLTPPVQAGSRTVVFEVMPTGCVRLTRR